MISYQGTRDRHRRDSSVFFKTAIKVMMAQCVRKLREYVTRSTNLVLSRAIFSTGKQSSFSLSHRVEKTLMKFT